MYDYSIIILFLIITLLIQNENVFAKKYDKKENLSNDDELFNPLEALELNPPFYQFWRYDPPSESDVKTAYRRLSLKYHPDKQSDPKLTEKFYLIRKSYEYLKGNDKQAEVRRKKEALRYKHYGDTLSLIFKIINNSLQFVINVTFVIISKLYYLYNIIWIEFNLILNL
jgi:preprotein translocase subunit Sec63